VSIYRYLEHECGSNLMSEIEQIEERYERRKSLPKNLYSYFEPSCLFIVHQRERVILRLLKKYKMNQLEDEKVLDIGCGRGGHAPKIHRIWGSPGKFIRD